MWKGIILSIHIAPSAAEPMVSVKEIRAIPGKGLEGDRYFNHTGTYSKKSAPDREVTLIEVEAIEALKRDLGIELDAGASRRNIVTRGVALNHLVGRKFRVGEVTLFGVRLCEPCSHLERLSHPRVREALIHRGGLRAPDGTIRVGDPVNEG